MTHRNVGILVAEPDNRARRMWGLFDLCDLQRVNSSGLLPEFQLRALECVVGASTTIRARREVHRLLGCSRVLADLYGFVTKE